MNEEKKTTSVQSVQRSFMLLELLHSYSSGASIKQLCEGMGLPKSTVHRLLANLVQLGYAVQNKESGRYAASYKMFEIGSGRVGQIDIVQAARPHLDRLAPKVRETVHLVVRDRWEVVYIYKSEAGAMQLSSRLGMRMPLYCSGVGKAILASLSYQEVEDVWHHSTIEPLTPTTVTTFEQLEKQLKEVRRLGYAVDDEENEVGIRCVAVALPRSQGEAAAAMSISGVKAAMDDARVQQLAAYCMEVKNEIMAELGYGGATAIFSPSLV